MLNRGLIVALLLGLLGGCAVTQKQRQSLDAYVQAMDQVRSGADALLTDYATSAKAAAVVQPAAAPSEYPDAFKLPDDDAVPTTEPGRSIASSRRALAVIRAYNAALVALAEGRSDDDVRAQITGFGNTLQSLGSIFGASIQSFAPFAGIGANIIKLAQDAANRKQLEAAVERGRQPIDIVLQSLQEQASAMYRFSVPLASQAQRLYRDEIRDVAERFAAFLLRQGPPVDAVVVGDAAKLQAELAEIGRRTGTLEKMPLPFRYGVGKPALDAATWREAEIFAQAMRGSAQKYVGVVARQKAYYELVSRYAVALRQANASLNALSASLSGPVDLREETAQLFSAAFGLRDAIAAYRYPGNPAPLVPAQ